MGIVVMVVAGVAMVAAMFSTHEGLRLACVSLFVMATLNLIFGLVWVLLFAVMVATLYAVTEWEFKR